MRLIDADALPSLFDEKFKKTMKLISEGESHLDNLAEGFTEAYQVVLKQPTIEAEPVVYGKWEWNENAIDWGLGAWVCSKCYSTNDNIHAKKDENPLFWKGSQRCPVCGAWMMSYTPPEPYKGEE